MVDARLAIDAPSDDASLDIARPSHSRLVLTRMLENLRRHYAGAQQFERVADTLELLAALHPDVPRIRELLDEHPRHHHLIN